MWNIVKHFFIRSLSMLSLQMIKNWYGCKYLRLERFLNGSWNFVTECLTAYTCSSYQLSNKSSIECDMCRGCVKHHHVKSISTHQWISSDSSQYPKWWITYLKILRCTYFLCNCQLYNFFIKGKTDISVNAKHSGK